MSLGFQELTDTEPSLSYSFTRTGPFSDFPALAKKAIYKLEVINAGKDEAENFRAAVTFPDEAKIEERKEGFPPALEIEVELETLNEFEFAAETVNPNDKLSVSFLVAFESKSPPKPAVDVRAKGVTGKDITPETKDTSLSYSLLLLGISIALISMVVSLSIRGRME